jgi:cobalt-zinc-cadmium efflux system protein
MSAHDHHDHYDGHHHADSHDHKHGHAHGPGGHHHAPASFGAAFALGTALNAGFVAVEIFFGIAAHSAALLADAVHNLGDVLGLLITWGSVVLARRHPTSLRTYGWGRGTILAALINAVVLLLGCGAIAIEALQRFVDPQPVAGVTIMWVAAIGIVINGVTALMFMSGRKGDLKIRGAFLHMASDAVVSAGVVIAGLLITVTHMQWIDPATSLVLVAVITIGTWSLLRDSVNLALDAVPTGVDLARVDAMLRGLSGVVDVHDLHVWGLSTTDIALTAHLVQDEIHMDNLVQRATVKVRDQFGIGHATFQIETTETAESCDLRPAHVV